MKRPPKLRDGRRDAFSEKNMSAGRDSSDGIMDRPIHWLLGRSGAGHGRHVYYSLAFLWASLTLSALHHHSRHRIQRTHRLFSPTTSR
ncbi:uncharacterized protein BDZ99DRAFT_259501 [Mytilinidion resinicola]|uniref:Uncharacterized protein n=1 Tax=Mytilinidion resinicola TaxID=574789 RepID=A0A6A6YYN5_9PEZI|nr:uncharacterized protein BDZ99DRAFT_259501 [Mytilinidion resinicola]KAF2813609.1 hypothetical protein BDZ99DRAFT_259501 [Mytilinidion resinicola]